MSVRELEQKLITAGIPPDAYSLNGAVSNEAYCLNLNNGVWEVYYSERGLKTNLKVFDSEDEACIYLSELLDNLKSID